MIRSHPLSILYFHGGVKGYWLGFAITILYTLSKVWSQNLRVADIYQVWISSMIFYEVLQAILNQGLFLWTGIQLFFGVSFLLLVVKKKQVLWKEQLLILYTGGQALFYSIHHNLLSAPMLTYLFMAIFLVIALRKWEVLE
ncbi:hypothetical protein J8TS2_27410 [Lederbergia ruris]|uniref:Uncharacterized protein n=2 Tax=Lederbergia ruris TaxID=217495 RepID=A0ABQ4KKE2_9BACI|nr:hypothetical protein J8TS2_27410 [Lederbergia ruris]